MKFAIAQKLEMTRVFDSEGLSFPATKLKLLPLKVSSLMEIERSGYNAVQVEIVRDDDKKDKKPYRAEFKVNDPKSYKMGDLIKYDEISNGDVVTISGKGKGKGFSGVIKRHGFSRGPMGHGSNHHRAPGSIGGGYPERVVAGRKMPGRLGGKKVTISNMAIMEIDAKNNVVMVSGSVPGPRYAKIKILVTKNAPDKAEVEE